MTRRPALWWWVRQSLSAVIFLTLGVVSVIVDELAVAIVALGAGATMLVGVGASRWLYRSGWHRGRMSVLVDQERTRRGLYVPRSPENPNPWDPFPEWPEAP